MYFSVHYVPMHSCSIMTMSELVPGEEVDPKTLENLPIVQYLISKVQVCQLTRNNAHTKTIVLDHLYQFCSSKRVLTESKLYYLEDKLFFVLPRPLK